MEKTKMKKIILMLVALLIIVVIGVFAITGGISKSENGSDNNVGNNTDIIADVEEKVERKPDIITETPYCQLHFPGEWEEAVAIENSSEDPYTVDYYGVLEEKKHLLFSLVFGESEGFCLGTISTAEGDVKMCIVEGALDDIDDYSDEDQKLLYDMQINVNYIIKNLEKDKNFKISEK